MRRWLPLILLVVLSTVAVPGLMADVLPLDTWESFSWDDGGTLPAGTSPASWTFTTTTSTTLLVTDGFVIGDEFSVTVGGSLIASFDTSAVNPALDGVGGPGGSGPEAWADTDYSHGSLSLGAGTYSVSIDVIRNAAGFTSGGAFVEDASLGTVPEPGSITLLGTVLLGSALLVRRRNAKRTSGSECRRS